MVEDSRSSAVNPVDSLDDEADDVDEGDESEDDDTINRDSATNVGVIGEPVDPLDDEPTGYGEKYLFDDDGSLVLLGHEPERSTWQVQQEAVMRRLAEDKIPTEIVEFILSDRNALLESVDPNDILAYYQFFKDHQVWPYLTGDQKENVDNLFVALFSTPEGSEVAEQFEKSKEKQPNGMTREEVERWLEPMPEGQRNLVRSLVFGDFIDDDSFSIAAAEAAIGAVRRLKFADCPEIHLRRRIAYIQDRIDYKRRDQEAHKSDIQEWVARRLGAIVDERSSTDHETETLPDNTSPDSPQGPSEASGPLAIFSVRHDELRWQEKGNCLGVDPDLFFPERGASTREAKSVCANCEVREDCLEFAITHGEKFGIWGGLSERERRRIRRQRALARRAAAAAAQAE